MLHLDQVELVTAGAGPALGGIPSDRMPRNILPIQAGSGATAAGDATPSSPTSIVTVRRVVRGA